MKTNNRITKKFLKREKHRGLLYFIYTIIKTVGKTDTEINAKKGTQKETYTSVTPLISDRSV